MAPSIQLLAVVVVVISNLFQNSIAADLNSTIPLGEVSEVKPNELVYLGMVEEKHFYYLACSGSWRYCMRMCHEENTDLASIETHVQTEFLLEALRRLISSSRSYWTAGSNFVFPSGYHWANTGKPMRSELFTKTTNYNMAEDPHKCLVLYVGADATKDEYFDERRCTNNQASGTICQAAVRKGKQP